MRRLVGAVASGLGMFLVVFALLMHFYVVGAAVKFPLGVYQVTTLHGDNVSYFSSAKVNEVSDVSMLVTNTTEGDSAAGNASRAVWNSFSYLYDQTNRQPFSYSATRMAFNRRTGALLNCCGSSVGNDTHVNMTGQGVLFPFNTKKQTYMVFNTTLLKPVAAKYAGTATVDGLSVYRFVTQVPATQAGTQSVPGSLVGASQTSVTLGEFYQATVTDWVDPITGTTVAVDEREHIGLRDSTGAEKLVVFDADLKTTPASVAQLVKKTLNYDNDINLVSSTLPLIIGIVGLVLIVAGIVVMVLGRNEHFVEAEM